ncbi:hypothetical protein BDN70DRAFT_888357 [Pholiota conissans]|uniref:Uncharacterized protein n=1 Tax=Pholiota conissans TaxID=109636 RepID=A0A9P6CSN3_9AGAR|nr:hypothetical protein BDN70DRAFT_888357 [Pholiota conissans]
MKLCDDYGPFDFRSPCIRASWSAFLPAALVFALCFCSVPIPRPVQHLIGILRAPFKSFLTLHEAEAVDVTAELGEATLEDEDTTDLVKAPKVIPVWRTVVFAFVGMLQAFYWVADGAYRLYNDRLNVWSGVFSFLVAISWTYTIVRPIARPTATPPYDMFAIYLVMFFAAILQLGGVWFDHNILAIPYPSAFTIAGLIANLLTVFALLTVVLSMPLAIPSNRVDKAEIGRSVSPEDYTSLWGWISFSWVYPLIHRVSVLM